MTSNGLTLPNSCASLSLTLSYPSLEQFILNSCQLYNQTIIIAIIELLKISMNGYFGAKMCWTHLGHSLVSNDHKAHDLTLNTVWCLTIMLLENVKWIFNANKLSITSNHYYIDRSNTHSLAKQQVLTRFE